MADPDIETVSLERLTRCYLQKQSLLPDSRGYSIEKAVGSICGLHAQAALTPYVSLWNRVEGFTRETLDDALYKRRSLVKTWFMRGTLHVILSKDLPIYHNALERMWFEHHGRYMRPPDWPSREERQRLFYPRILKVLDEKPLRRKELNEKVLSAFAEAPKSYQRLFSGWGGILKETGFRGLTVHAEPCGNEACFARLDRWLPNIDLDGISEDEARAVLFRMYLRGYGPASTQDFTYWSGLMAGETRKACEANESKLRTVRVEGSDKKLWMLKEDFKTLERLDLQERVSPCLLPKFDPFLLGHKDRSRFVSDTFLKHVYRKAGDIVAVLLINGRIAGSWTSKKTKKKLTVHINSFEKLEAETQIELKRIVKSLGEFMNVEEAELLLKR
ncbi:MAG TPA: winged helix DNA-binding domain-containing protein [Candidatus Acidoferrum sp.]|jgi:uncharacterized protein YcaQ|nr:winged helix DNA-binding domain-containing protein [Candidatus Acidoferrum sp.]